MTFENIDPTTAHQRQSEGWRYVDVRTPEEFAAGHPEGAINVPVAFVTPTGMQANPDFVQQMAAHTQPTDKLLLGCKSGGRSARAAMMLEQVGYQHLANVDGGFLGSPTQAGWSQLGLPSSGGVEGG
ncbi:MAG: rhodanese-like domain-containing protein [Myxococcales bacterium]|nr:rhodanese-like domain-containing protein [Myxococcales bacterium]